MNPTQHKNSAFVVDFDNSYVRSQNTIKQFYEQEGQSGFRQELLTCGLGSLPLPGCGATVGL